MTLLNTQITPTDHNDAQLIINKDMKKLDQFLLTQIDSDVAFAQEIARYVIDSPSKKIRSQLTLIFANLFVPSNKILSSNQYNTHIEMAGAIELIHNASLVHDDVLDQSDKRRGSVCTHLVWNNKAAILIGDFLLTKALNIMLEQDVKSMRMTFHELCTNIVSGEIMQLEKCSDLEQSISHCKSIIQRKTAILFAAACKIGAITGYDRANIQVYNNDLYKEIYEFGINVGMCFQIIDDLLDYDVVNNDLDKNIGDDFYECKVTLPVIIAYQNSNAQNKNFMHQAFDREMNKEQRAKYFAKTLSILNETDAINKSRMIAANYANKGLNILSKINKHVNNNEMLLYLQELLNKIIIRKN